MELTQIVDVTQHLTKRTGISVRDISRPYYSCVEAPSFMFGPAPSHLNQALFGQMEVGPLLVHDIRDACVSFEGSVLWDGAALVSPSWNTHPPDIERGRSMMHGSPLNEVYVEGVCATICGPGISVYGHWLVDFLPRLYLLDLLGYDLGTLNYVIPASTPPYAFTLLEMIGIRRERLLLYDHFSSVVRCERLLIPSLLRWGNRMHRAFRWAAQTLFWKVPALSPGPSLGQRLFIERPEGNLGRRVRNASELRRRALDRGFVALEPSSLPLIEQARVFSDARQIIGEYGSALHNVVFSSSSILTCALRGTSMHPGFIQSGINQALGHRTGYVFAESPQYDIEQEIEFDMAHFAAALDWLDVDAQNGFRRV